MDVLSDVLRVVRVTSAVFFTARFSSRWSIGVCMTRTEKADQNQHEKGLRPPLANLLVVLCGVLEPFEKQV